MNKKMLIITKKIDLSIKLFSTDKIKEVMDIDFIYIEDNIDSIKEKILDNKFDYIYIRDPFNIDIKKDELDYKLNYILKNNGDAYMIDNIYSIEDIYLEDKWEQYKKYKAYMPKTKELNEINKNQLTQKTYIIKEKISSMAKGIFFDINSINKDYNNYIMQDRMLIEKEYRIFVLFNDIITLAGQRSSKTEDTKVKVIGTEEISIEVKNFLKKILKENKFDFIGVDIAISGNNMYLIEINRSCFFGAYLNHTGINLAENFIKRLLKKP